jgi:hypothetical protein
LNISTVRKNGVIVAVVDSAQLVIADVQSALDLIATVWHEAECYRMVVPQNAISEDFFQLSSGLAGEVLQKCVNYRMKLAIVGDFSRYHSKPLRDFIYESNQGSDVFFVATLEEALERLAKAE